MSARRLVLVPHTHWDREWYRSHESFRYRLVRLMDGLLDTLEREPRFRHFTLDGQTMVLSDYLEIRPEARERIAKLAGDGRLSLGPWTVLPDEWLVSGEALIRNLRAGLAVAERFGGAMEVGYVPDQFGHVGQLPQIFAGFGFDAAVVWRGVGPDVDGTLFHWEAPDGTRLLTAYLKTGYGNAVHLPRDPEALAARLRREASALETDAPIGTLLMMNGSDHVAPDPDLPSRLARAAAWLPDATLEIGSLPGYLARAREEAPEALPVHRGELRSGLRSPLLAGCASSRMPQKRADFENDRLLTRYLEPLAAWLGRLGGDPDVGLLDAIWRIVLENHPHDSICGCSIDAVHTEMDARFARVRDLAEAHLSRVCADLARRVAPAPGAGAPLVVWNPHAAGPAEARGRVELPLELAVGEQPALVVCDAEGRPRAAYAEIVRGSERYADYALTARVVAQLVRGFPPEFFGDPVCHAELRNDGDTDVVEIWLGEQPPAGFDWEDLRSELARSLEASGERATRFRPLRQPLVELRIADELPGAGLRTYRVRTGDAAREPDGPGPRVRAEQTPSGVALENDTLRVAVTPDGRVRIRHAPTQRVVDDALRLSSEGDRGDTYTFDPLSGALPVERPESAQVSLGACTWARAEARVDATYRVPRELDAGRGRRSAETVALPVRIRLALAAGLDRIDVRIECDNTAADQRLRVLLRAPFAAERFEVESAFLMAPRPIAPAPDAFGSEQPAERPSAATPQRRFATLTGDGALLCVANRGLPEVAAVPEGDGRTSLAVTLLRATGWLSRGDLVRRPGHAGPPLATPGAQVPGRHVAELGIFLRSADDTAHRAEALRFAEPPLVFAGSGIGGDAPLADGARLLELDDPEVVLSALEPLAGGETGVRLYNPGPEPRRLSLRWNGGGPGLEPVDLRGRPAPDAEVGPRARRELRLRGHEILALRAR